MPYVQLYYHLVWATKHRAPILMPEIEPAVHRFMRAKAEALGARVQALDGIRDHVHLVCTIPPSMSVATFIGQVKGASSAQTNKAELLPGHFAWQEEYGAFSFDRKSLHDFVAYLQRQKAHHYGHTTIPVLERDDTPTSIEEIPEIYATEDSGWRTHLESYLSP